MVYSMSKIKLQVLKKKEFNTPKRKLTKIVKNLNQYRVKSDKLDYDFLNYL